MGSIGDITAICSMNACGESRKGHAIHRQLLASLILLTFDVLMVHLDRYHIEHENVSIFILQESTNAQGNSDGNGHFGNGYGGAG